jgi:hypothetical protein
MPRKVINSLQEGYDINTWFSRIFRFKWAYNSSNGIEQALEKIEQAQSDKMLHLQQHKIRSDLHYLSYQPPPVAVGMW